MRRSPRLECARTVARLAALAAPLLAWVGPASASPEPAPADDITAPAAPAAPGAPAELTASPDAPPPPPPVALDAAPEAPVRSVSMADAVAARAAAAPVAPHADHAVAAVRTTESSSGSPWIGAMADVGLPDAATMSIVVRPIRSLRAHAGLSHNLISLGQRAGITWAPLSWWASPTLSLEYGHYADGNANPLVRRVTGDQTFSSAVLDRVGYDYANAHLGLEFGQRWFTFYIHGGVSRITAAVHNLSAETMSQSSGTTSVSFSRDPHVQLTTVSARIGFIVYLAN
jgi:hypothetical protein